MNRRSNAVLIEDVVVSTCDAIRKEYEYLCVRKLLEEDLWGELATCLLSSQVQYASAQAAAACLMRSGVLGLYDQVDADEFVSSVVGVLAQPYLVDGKYRRYRFPNSRGRQLAIARIALHQSQWRLQDIVYGNNLDISKRHQLIQMISGIGPKQSSMFLRNIGVSYDLAIIDTHVQKYLQIVLGIDRAMIAYRTLADYERIEQYLKTYASKVGVVIGILDFAIWLVLKNAPAEMCRAA